MDEQIKMHTEYRVEVKGEGEWFTYNHVTFSTSDSAKEARDFAKTFYPTRKGYKHRIAVRLVGDWCEMKENGK